MGLDSFKLCPVPVPNMKDVRVLLLSLVLLCRQLDTATLEMPVSCEAGRFKTRDTASVTCIFPEHIQERSQHVFITWYPFNSSESEDIFRCTWTNQTIQPCTVKAGFRFNGNISDQLKVEIPGVTADFSGRYVCQLVTAEPRPLSMCNLTVQETLTTPEEKPATGLSTSVIAVLSSLIPITIIGLIVFAVVYIRKRRSEVSSGIPTGPRVRKVTWSDTETDGHGTKGRTDYPALLGVPSTGPERTKSVGSNLTSEGGSASSFHTASETSQCSADASKKTTDD